MDLPKRKSPRLKGYDYSTPGYYFVTMCTHNKQKMLGEVMEGKAVNVGEGLRALPKVRLSSIGKTVDEAIKSIDSIYSDVSVDKYVIMPNYIHMIIIKHPAQSFNGFRGQVTGGHGDPPLRCTGIDNVVGRLKSYTTHQYGKTIWQRSFHDHIIRGEKDYQKIWQYIDSNPARWKNDCLYID